MKVANHSPSSEFFKEVTLRGLNRLFGRNVALALPMLILSNTPCLVGQTLASQADRERLLDVYAQGEANNCGSVATTKFVAALFGVSPPHGPFSAVSQPDHSIAVLLADNSTKIFVTEKQLSLAKEESGFRPKGSNESEFANLLYAAMAVEMTTRDAGSRVTDGRKVSDVDYQSALDTMYEGGDGADADTLPLLLGFKFEDHSNTNYLPAVYMLGSSIHIGYVTDSLYDEHGFDGGNDVNEFRRRYGARKKEQMYRYFLLEPTGSEIRSTIIRQCAAADKRWVVEAASWTPRSDCSE